MNLEQEARKFMEDKGGSLTFDSYQKQAKKTAIYPKSADIMYPALGLTGEAGEVANKVKKIVRDGRENSPPDWREQIAYELGDVLWYCAALASDLGLSLGRIATENADKLSGRKERGTLGGSGDSR
jgi:NTP pyrophosphatase (non-canonical NTP hydrolase)|tara:strand:+ start:63 stop:440 length:378 start_codon:yes stop_codon:yes gene_type:complete